MKLSLLCIVTLCLVSSSVLNSCTRKQLIQVMNQARQDPKEIAKTIKKEWQKNGERGSSGDYNCYSDGFATAMKQAPLNIYTEEDGADETAQEIADLQASHGYLSHSYGSSTPQSRVKKHMTSGAKKWPEAEFKEIIASWSAERAYCMIWIAQFWADCGVSSRGHRKAIEQKDLTYIGAGVKKQVGGGRWNYTFIGFILDKNYVKKGGNVPKPAKPTKPGSETTRPTVPKPTPTPKPTPKPVQTYKPKTTYTWKKPTTTWNSNNRYSSYKRYSYYKPTSWSSYRRW